MSSTLPTGETLPEYDDQHPEGVDVGALHAWLRQRFPNSWGVDEYLNDVNRMVVERGHRLLIGHMLAALAAVGDATLVRNSTYRAMRKDGADIERLAARLANTGRSALLIEAGGPVGAALAILTELDADTAAPPPAVTG